MKRIDDKIKEIEKKDKKNRILYIAFVALIFAFMAFFFFAEKRNVKKNTAIDRLEVENSTYYKDLEAELTRSEELYDSLQNSLRPEDYWNYTKEENSVEGYIAFITKDWGIDNKKFLPDAIDKLKSSGTEVAGFRGWLYVGLKKNSGYEPVPDKIEVIYRENKKVDPNKEPEIANSEPQIGDILKLKTRNQNTYKTEKTNSANDLGWRNKTKAFVVAKSDSNSVEVKIEIRYY